jgi:hypothetical protein
MALLLKEVIIMSKTRRMVAEIFLILNILIICALSAFAYYGKYVGEYLDHDYFGHSASINGIDTEISFFDLLKFQLFPDSFDVNEANRVALDGIEHTKPYDNHIFQVDIEGDENVYASVTVKQDKNRMYGTIKLLTKRQAKSIQSNEFYITINEDDAIVRIEYDGAWCETTVPAKMFADYEITNLIDMLSAAEFASFPRQSFGGWDMFPQNSFISEIDFYKDGRAEHIKATLPNSASMNSLFSVITKDLENIEINYSDRGNCGNIVIDEPDWDELNIRKVDNFDEVFNREIINYLVEKDQSLNQILDSIILPEGVGKETYEEKMTIINKILKDDLDDYHDAFINKVIEQTTNSDSYDIWIQAPIIIEKNGKRLSLSYQLEADVRGDQLHGTISVYENSYFQILKEFEIYQSLDADGRIITYIKNEDAWYVYRSISSDHQTITFTPKDMAKMFEGSKAYDGLFPMMDEDGSQIVYVNSASITQFEFANILEMNSAWDVSLSADNFQCNLVMFSGDVKRQKLFDMYKDVNDPLLNKLMTEYEIYDAAFSIQAYNNNDNDAELSVDIPEHIVNSAIEINSLNFIYEHVELLLNDKSLWY